MKKIKINGKEIPRIKELTVKQLMQVNEKCYDEKMFNYLKYIALFTGYTYEQILKSKVNKLKLTALINYIDGFNIDYKNQPTMSHLKIGDKVCEISGMGLDTIGKEYMFISIQATKELNEMDIYRYILAIQFADENDFSTVEENLKHIDDLNWVDVFSAGSFFFRHSRIFQKSGRKYLKTLTLYISTKIHTLRNRLELIGYRLMLWKRKLKAYFHTNLMMKKKLGKWIRN